MARGEIKALLFADGVAVTAAVAAPTSVATITDTSGWNGSTATVTYDLSVYSVTDAKAYQWTFQDLSSNSYKVLNPEIDFPSATSIRVTFGTGFEPSAGTYRLIGK